MDTPTNTLPTFGEARRALLAAIAARLGKHPADLIPWVDYDPITLDEDALHISRGRPTPRWTGD